jgi:hypothetical protein
MDKEYGKLTPDQFQQFIKKLPELREQIKEFPLVVKAASPELVQEVLDKDFSWADVYELPLLHGIALLFMAMGRVRQLAELASAADPQGAAFEWLDNDEFEDWNGGEGGVFQKKHVVGLTVALQRNVLSIMLYHRSLCTLVEEVRTGNDDSLFRAVRVDRSAVACSTFADRIARAELEDDKAFFRRLSSAFKGPSKKHMEAFKDLRYALFMLRDLGFDQLTDAQLEDLLVNKLKLYSPHVNARKNLRKQFTESKKISTPSKPNFR